MNTYDPSNEYDTLIMIFRFVRDYSTSSYPLTRVCRELLAHLKNAGYNAAITGRSGSDSQTITVNGHQFRIVHWPNWSKYDVQLIA